MGEAVVVFGSREGVPRAAVEQVIQELRPDITIVVGTTPIGRRPDGSGIYHGVDADVLEIALELRRSVIVLPARWDDAMLLFGTRRPAGPIRNGWMEHVSDRGIGLRRPGVSRGTDDMDRKLRRSGKVADVRLVQQGGK